MRLRGWLVVGVTVLAFACRLPLAGAGVWRDEGSTYFDAAAPTLAAALREIRAVEISPPLYFLAMHAWLRAAGANEIALRVPSLACGIALVPVTYAIARMLQLRGAAVIAASFAAFSATAITLSTEARPYAPAAFLAGCATLAALRFLGRRGAPLPSLLAFVACGLALAYTHYTGVIFLFALGIGALAFLDEPAARRRVAALWLAEAVVAAGFAPWLPYARKLHEATFLARTDPVSPFGHFIEQVGFLLPVDVLHVQYAFVALIALVVVPVTARLRRKPHDEDAAWAPRTALSAAVVVGAACETALAIHEQRYVFVFAPLAYSLFAWFAVALVRAPVAWWRSGRTMRGAFGAAAGCAFVATLVAGIPNQLRFSTALYRTEKSGVRALVDAGRFDARTLVVVVPDYLGPSLGYYLDGSGVRLAGVPHWDAPEHSRCCAGGWRSPGLIDDTLRRILGAVPRRYDRVALVWDVDARDEGDVPYARTFALRRALGNYFPLISERRFPGIKEHVALSVFRVPRG